MASQGRFLARREFLRLLTAGAGVLAVACSGAPAAAPTSAPAKPAETKPAETKPAAPAASPAAAAPGASPAAAASPAAGASPAPAGSPAAKPAAAAAPKFTSNGSKLTIWGWQSFTPEGDKLLGDQMKEWGAANKTDIEYVVIENAQFPQKLAAAIEAKATPDITMLTSPTDVLNFASRDLFVDVADLWKGVADVEGGFYDYVKDYYNIGNAIFAIPFEADTSPLFTRLDLVEKATGKREPPKTLDELTEVSKKINTPPSVYALGICLGRTPDGEGEAVQLIWNDGGSLVTKDGKPNLNSQGTIDAMKRLKGWWDDKLIPPASTTWDDTGNNSAYQAKQVAFVRNPPSIYAWMQTNDQQLLKDSTMAAFPAGKGGSYSSSGAWSWSVFKTSKNADGAKDLIFNLMDPKRLQTVYEAVGGRWYPIYKNGSQHEYWKSREIFKFYPDLLAGGRGLWYPSSPEPKLMAALGETRTRNVIPDMVQDIVVKGTAVEAAVKTAHDAMTEIFKARGANV
ncbi:MAG: extracellular solute-binding protein [Chloroflexi bacterium]|nr:extracellular solute-binding protein [Chloroflexota bacterium]